MRSNILAILLAASALTTLPALAQTPPAPATAPASGPANICTELVAFLTPKPPAPAAPAAATPAAPAAPAQAQPQSPPAQTQPSGSAAAPPAAQGGSAQQASGQSGTAVEAPKPGPPAATGSGQNAPQTSGMSAPVPKPAEPPKKKPSLSLEQGQALASANDIAGCHSASRKIRREGVDMPPALLALAALDLKYYMNTAPAAPTGATP